MAPCFPGLNVANCRFANAMYYGNGSVMLAFGQSCTNVCNASCGKFRPSIARTGIRSSVALLVGVVVLVRVVTEVTQAVIHGVAIVVANVHSRRARPNECRHNKRMNQKGMRLAVVPTKLHGAMAVLSWSRCQNSGRDALRLFGTSIAQHCAVITDEVARKAINRTKSWCWN